MKYLKRRVEKLEDEQQTVDDGSLDLYYCLVGKDPQKTKGSHLDLTVSEWLEGLISKS